jgi:hypothetical protein
MAYVVPTRTGAWEIRESQSTRAGPRSHTLATFRVLTPDIIERARRRAAKSLEPRDLTRAALRAGATVAAAAPDRAARDLLGELTAGRRPRRVLRHLLADALGDDGSDLADLSDSVRSAAAWAASDPQRRAEALYDLLLLSDRLPARTRHRSRRFPRLESTTAP